MRYIIYLIGYPGTGKKTIAQSLLVQSEKAGLDMRLLDNHVINNPIFTILRDADKPLPESAWQAVDKIWDLVFEQIRDHAPKDRSFILTNHLLAGDAVDEDYFKEVQSLAEEINALFLPICLSCAEDEWLKRLQDPKRNHDLKLTNAALGHKIREKGDVINVTHPHHLALDVTDLQPDEAATEILLHLQKKARKTHE